MRGTDFLVVAAVAFATVLVATPVVGWMAERVGAVAVPGARNVHTRTTPTLGGLAILAGILAAFGVASQLPGFAGVFRDTNEPEAIVLGALVITAVGIRDDTRDMSPPAKVAGQVLAASLLALFGLALRFQFIFLPGPDGGQLLSIGPDVSAVLTVFGLVAMMNAVNLVDGLDGLAAGIVAIAAAALFVHTQLAETIALESQTSAPMLLAALVGACLGFLVHNFNPAAIFMGDTGAMLLGLLLGAAGVSTVGSTISVTGTSLTAVSVPILLPVLVLAIPFADTTLTVVRRLARGRSVATADKEHLHHRLVEIGHSHRRAVLILYYWSALLAFAAVGVSLVPSSVLVAVLSAGVGLGLVVALGGRLVRRVRGVRTR